MATTNVQFYEKVKDLQEIQHSSEQKRMELERKLNSYVKSDQRLAKLKAVRLQNYWKKICEDEKRSQWRNEQLLRDVERVENHMASLSEKTEKLKVMKRQYEEYIERMYPQWKEKVVVFQQQRKEAERLALEREKQALQQSFNNAIHQQYQAHMASTNVVSSTPVPQQHAPAIQTPITSQRQPAGFTQPPLGLGATQERLQQARDILNPMAGAPHHGGAESVSQPQYLSQPMTQEPAETPSPARGSLREDPRYQHLHSTPQQNLSPGETVIPQAVSGALQNSAGGHMTVPSASSTMHTVSSLPTGMTPGSTLGHTVDSIPEERAVPQIQRQVHTDYDTEQSRPREAQSNTTQVTGRRKSSIETGYQHPVPQPRTPRDRLGSQDSHHSVMSRQRSVDEDSGGFGSDTSLPLSPREEAGMLQSSAGLLSARSEGLDVDGAIPAESLQAPVPRPQSADLVSEKAIYPEPDVTLDGLYNLLFAVQSSFQYSATPNEFYREESPPPSVKRDIIDHANRSATISHLDSRSVSMVVLEQLPLVVVNCEGNCLLPDMVLYSPPQEISQYAIRCQIHPTCLDFWDKLYEHFVKITKYHVMEPEEIGRMFGPLLIRTDSPYEEKAISLITDLMENLPPEASAPSPGSTATLSSLPTSPRGKPLPRQIDAAPRTKPPGMDTDISEEEDDFFAKPVPKEEATGALTQSAAYRALLGDTMSTQKSVQFEYEDSDDSDDVERQLTRSITSPRVKATKKQTFGKPEEVPVSAAAREDDKSEGSVSFPSGGLPSTHEPPVAAYIPTAMENTGKSTLSASSKSARKPGFRFGDSDTDEDVDVLGHSGPSKAEPEADDFFDFYD